MENLGLSIRIHIYNYNETGFIVELKKDKTVYVAINQIKSKEYVQKCI
ncbi:MAG: hypothetical protein RSD36_04225 [Terrisporobacter sp.]